MRKSIVLTLGLVLAIVSASFAQKFGYCNSRAILLDMPEMKEAESTLRDFQNQKTKQGQQRVKDFQDKVAEYERKSQQGLISPKDAEGMEAKLKEEQEALIKLDQDIAAELAARREKLYAPILEKVNKALEEISRANGFTYVFDMTSSVLLYADESLDVTALLKAKLGIQ